MMLDLPEHLRIIVVGQSPEDTAADVCSIVVTGPFCPECPPGAPPAVLLPIYRSVYPGGAELLELRGLDT